MASTKQKLVTTSCDGGLFTVTLNRPEKRNALNQEILEDLEVAVNTAASDSEVRCVILRGEGPMFSSGMDLNSLNDLSSSPEALRPFREAALSIYNTFEQMNKPTICQIHGACIGGAAELSIACDFRTMAENAVFGIPEVKLGLIPDLGGCSRLPALIGVGRAKELIMTGRMIGAQEAQQIGLVNRTASSEELDSATRAFADELLSSAPLAVGLAKAVVDAAAKPGLVDSLAAEVDAQEKLVSSADFAEGASAFLEKRQPQFKGG